MKWTIPSLFRWTTSRKGETGNAGTFENAKFQAALLDLFSERDRLRIVVVGANDGKVNDPVYPVVTQFPMRSDILLVEPQKALLPYLKANYAFHPHSRIVNSAVGGEDELTLYSVKQEYWERVDTPYARDWPPYRAPTGVTSSDRNHVRNWLRGHLRDKGDVDDAIEETIVPCRPLIELLDDQDWPRSIDVLQVDTEGLDDEVIYSCDVETTRPALIYFEIAHLGEAAAAQLERYLRDLEYSVSRDGRDALAVLSNDR